MNIGTRLFLSSAFFGIVIALAYRLITHDITGTLLLGSMALALSFAAGYMIFAERAADLVGDLTNAEHKDHAGESTGVFTLRSSWPITLAATSALLLLGATFNAPLAIGAFVIVLILIAHLIRESR